MMKHSYGEMIPAKRRGIGKSARCESILNILSQRDRAQLHVIEGEGKVVISLCHSYHKWSIIWLTICFTSIFAIIRIVAQVVHDTRIMKALSHKSTQETRLAFVIRLSHFLSLVCDIYLHHPPHLLKAKQHAPQTNSASLRSLFGARDNILNIISDTLKVSNSN